MVPGQSVGTINRHYRRWDNKNTPGEKRTTVEYALVYAAKCIPAGDVTSEPYMRPGSLITFQSTDKDGSGYLDTHVVRPLIT